MTPSVCVLANAINNRIKWEKCDVTAYDGRVRLGRAHSVVAVKFNRKLGFVHITVDVLDEHGVLRYGGVTEITTKDGLNVLKEVGDFYSK